MPRSLMIPTSHLRYITSSQSAPHLGEGISVEVQVLQQKWMKVLAYTHNQHPDHVSEWRDIPHEEAQHPTGTEHSEED